eukprot:g25203.t1
MLARVDEVDRPELSHATATPAADTSAALHHVLLARLMPSRSSIAFLGLLCLTLVLSLYVFLEENILSLAWTLVASQHDVHAPTTVALSMLFSTWAGGRVIRGRRANRAAPSGDEMGRALDILAGQPNASAGLVRLGDKRLLFSDCGKAFIMYARHGRSWAALFDPVGCAKAWPALVMKFMEEARKDGCRAVFYQVSPDFLPCAVEAGLKPYKLGEQAVVDLARFDLKGGAWLKLRRSINRAERDGLQFSMLRADEVPGVLDELLDVSRTWLSSHNAAEKGFSLGKFQPQYVAAGPVAVIRLEGRIVAFANILSTSSTGDAFIDLMRHVPDTHRGMMDLLFVRIMEHMKAEGFRTLNLGMAPLAGLATHRKAPLWNHLGGRIFRSGERFYNFKGVLAFKSKFDPEWQPRYLAVSGRGLPLMSLYDVTMLIGGGEDRMSAELTEAGAIVVGVDVPEYYAALSEEERDCLYLVSDIEELSRRLHREQDLQAYHAPLVAGAGEGGALALAIAAQTPASTIGATIAVDPDPAIGLSKILCTPAQKAPFASGMRYGLSDGPLPNPVQVFFTPGSNPQGRRHVEHLKTSHPQIAVKTQSTTAETALIAAAALQVALASTANAGLDLPIVPIDAVPRRNAMAVIYSGDGGWRDIDQKLAAYMKDEGVPVVGVDALRYFWSEKSPEQTAADLSRIIATYRKRWNVDRVVLVGYSFGANILPATYRLLPKENREAVSLLSLLALSHQADFEIAVTGWLGFAGLGKHGDPVDDLREIEAAKIQCVYGRAEEDTACPAVADIAGAQVLGAIVVNGCQPPITDRMAPSTARITRVRMKVAKSEFTFSIPILAKIAVSAAKTAERTAQNCQPTSMSLLSSLRKSPCGKKLTHERHEVKVAIFQTTVLGGALQETVKALVIEEPAAHLLSQKGRSVVMGNHVILKTVAAVGISAMLAGTAVAHHGWSWAQGEQTTLEGTIRSISFAPPHPSLKVEAEGTVWQIDLGNPRQTERSGFAEGSAKACRMEWPVIWLEPLAATPVARLLATSSTIYLLVNAAHILSLAMLFGAILALDLLLIGKGRTIPLAAAAPYLARLAATGLLLAVATGLCLFSVRPTEYAQNPAFLIKLGLIALGLANIAVLHFGRGWSRVIAGGAPGLAVRIGAASSILIWMSVVIAGRWIGFL